MAGEQSGISIGGITIEGCLSCNPAKSILQTDVRSCNSIITIVFFINLWWSKNKNPRFLWFTLQRYNNFLIYATGTFIKNKNYRKLSLKLTKITFSLPKLQIISFWEALWGIRGVYAGYSWGIHGIYVCIGYVSGMYRVCVGKVSKGTGREGGGMPTTDEHGWTRKKEYRHPCSQTRRNLNYPN